MNFSQSQQAFDTQPLPLQAVVLAQQLVLLPLYFYVPVWIPFFNSIAAIAVLYRQNHPQFQIPRWAKLAITFLAISSVLIIFRKFSGRDAGIALISAMYGLKILETHTKRDANLLLSLGFFMIVAGFLFSQKPWIAIYQFVPVLAILNAFLAMQSLQKVPLSGASFSKVVKDLGRYLLIAIPIMIVLFVFFPRLSGPLWRMPGNKMATSGVSDVMGLNEIGQLQLSDEVAFRVNFEGQEPEDVSLYWRVLVLDRFDGLTWTRQGRGPVGDRAIPEQKNSVIDYTVTLEPTQLKYLISLDRPLTTPKNAVLIDDYIVYSNYRILDRTRYTMTSDISAKIDLQEKFSPDSIYLNLPQDSNNRTRNWAVDRRKNYTSDSDFIQGILEQINQQEYFYTLSPGIMDEPVIDSFWFDKQRGFCEHYASSLVFIARAAGIPARVVVGYQGGEKNPLSDYWIVRQNRAHAWAEIWLRGRGWVRVDPTSAIARHRIEPNLLEDYNQRSSLFDDFDVVELDDLGIFKKIDYWMDQMDSRWNDWILDYNSQRQRQLFSFWGLERVTSQQLYFGIIVLVSFFVLLASFRWFHQSHRGDPLARAFSQMLKRVLAHKRLVSEQNEDLKHLDPISIGPMRLCEILQQKDAETFKQHIDLIQQYIQIRYQTPITSDKKNTATSKRLTKAIKRL